MKEKPWLCHLFCVYYGVGWDDTFKNWWPTPDRRMMMED